MRRITLFLVSTVAVVVLLFSYRTSLGDSGSGDAAQALSAARVVVSSPVAAPSTGSAAGPDPTSDSTPAPGGSGATDSTGGTGTQSAAAASGTQTVQGAAEMTRYGQVQVQVVITDGKITDVQALQYPTRERRDQEINAQAIPLLRNEVLSAQSAHVQGVSGATFTTEGYLASVQSALDAAGFSA